MPNSKRAMDIIIFGSGLLMACIHLGLLISANDFAKFEQYLAFGLAMFLIVVGNVLSKTERNFFIGIRLPWTLASEENWRATHRLAGKLMVIFGLLLLGSAFFVQNVVITVVLSTSPLIIPVFYSYFYYARKEKKRADDIQTTRHRL